jgi:hypothetical protein
MPGIESTMDVDIKAKRSARYRYHDDPDIKLKYYDKIARNALKKEI